MAQPTTSRPANGPPPLVSHCVELLESAGTVRTRRMFGGWGFYVDGLFVALVAGNSLFLKVNRLTKPRFQAAGGQPFVYTGKNQPVQVDYYTPPDEALDSPALMHGWVALAMQAALAAKTSNRRSLPADKPAKAAASSFSATPGARPRRPRSNNSR